MYGRLLSEADSSVQLIIDDSASEFTIGRGNCSLRIDNARISSLHARITIADNTVQIEDLSTNGVWLNGAKLGKGSGLHALSHLDELACSILGDQGAAARFIFAVPSERRQQMQQGPGLQASNPASRAGSPNAKRQKTDGAGASSSSAAAAGSSSAAAGSSSTAFSAAGAADDEEEVEKQLHCGICQDILYKPVAVQPCMHVFCGACFCEWMKRAHNCPQCRQPVRVVARNHTVANIVDAYLAQHPNKARDPTETARLDAEDTIGNVPRAIRQRDREEGMEMFEYSAGGGANDEDDYSGSDGGDYSDDDDDGGLMDMIMAQARANTAAAGLPPDQAAHAAAFAHLQALQARAAPPLVAAPRTPCASCTGLFLRTAYRPMTLRTSSHTTDCSGQYL